MAGEIERLQHELRPTPCFRRRSSASTQVAARPTQRRGSISSELRTLGVRCARKRVARLMREAGLFGCGGRRRRKTRTTLRSHIERNPPAPDLVKRNFTSEAPNRLWVADITYVRTWEGWLYLSFVLDTYSRKIVGWSMANNLKTGLVVDAVNMAIYTCRPSPGLIHHSDRGSQPGFKGSSSLEAGSERKVFCPRWVP